VSPGRKLARALLEAASFPGFVLGMIALTRFAQVPGLHRYDLLLLCFLGWQLGMWLLKVETTREVAAIFLFHLMGVTLEMWKVAHGGWSYPEPGLSKVLEVPLYSGFMYASIGSFFLALWKRLELRMIAPPPVGPTLALTALAYVNFWTNVWLPDLKPLVVLLALPLFWRSRLQADLGRRVGVPLLLVFPLLGGAVWLAENWGTAFGSWRYPRQDQGWTWVPEDKLLSWTVLVLVSVVIVWLLDRGLSSTTTRSSDAPPAAP
jgi:uncharacterized membrane protein YoaT (DUF817 family)